MMDVLFQIKLQFLQKFESLVYIIGKQIANSVEWQWKRQYPDSGYRSLNI